MSSLMPAGGGDGPLARCSHCGVTAVGPCARCRRPVCGDCCELTEGGANTFAVCLRCAKEGGTSLASAWLGLLGWLGLVMAGCVGIAVLLYLLRR